MHGIEPGQLIVQKFGGATLATPEKVRKVAERIAKMRKSGVSVVAVVSAMGQTTNQLIDLAQQVSKNPPLREMDMLMSVGERISMALLSMALHDLGCDAISFTGSQAGILTDDDHISANIIDVKPIRVVEALKSGKVVVLAGFQGVSAKTKEITTLGRGGSDITAVAVAQALHANRCEILKDVDSIFSADPSKILSAKPLRKLSSQQLFEMTYWGAKVVNYRSAKRFLDFSPQGLSLYIGPAHSSDLVKMTTETEVGTMITPQVDFSEFSALSVNLISEAWFVSDATMKQLTLNGFQILAEVKSSHQNGFWITAPTEILGLNREKTAVQKTAAIATVTFSRTLPKISDPNSIVEDSSVNKYLNLDELKKVGNLLPQSQSFPHSLHIELSDKTSTVDTLKQIHSLYF